MDFFSEGFRKNLEDSETMADLFSRMMARRLENDPPRTRCRTAKMEFERGRERSWMGAAGGGAVRERGEPCGSCQLAVINGVICHERGCPDAWVDEVRECRWCGSEFRPGSGGQRFCQESCEEVYLS